VRAKRGRGKIGKGKGEVSLSRGAVERSSAARTRRRDALDFRRVIRGGVRKREIDAVFLHGSALA